MSTPVIVGFAVAGAATAARLGLRAFQEYQKMPKAPRLSKFYKGGFDAKMNKREAALILGIRKPTDASCCLITLIEEDRLF
ncbi:hypothetical protein G6F62_014703 [Rhizopus arrhizus]|nr:hypothetical protein G6F62_014703 [Rhizopus arrhizus]